MILFIIIIKILMIQLSSYLNINIDVKSQKFTSDFFKLVFKMGHNVIFRK